MFTVDVKQQYNNNYKKKSDKYTVIKIWKECQCSMIIKFFYTVNGGNNILCISNKSYCLFCKTKMIKDDCIKNNIVL